VSRRIGLASLLLLVALLAAACQGGSEEPRVASGRGVDAAGATPTTAGGSSDRFQQVVAYSRCMREHGVPKFPDPKPGPNGEPNLQITPDQLGVGQAQLQAAEQACQGLAPPSSPARQQGQYEGALKYADCMRKNGVPDFPDPKRGANGGVILGGSGVNPNSPSFQKAQQACRSIMQAPGAPAESPGGQG
jgi:hypothetical protein